MNNRQKKHREKMKAEGRCIYCGQLKEVGNNYVGCYGCMDKKREKMREHGRIVRGKRQAYGRWELGRRGRPLGSGSMEPLSEDI